MIKSIAARISCDQCHAEDTIEITFQILENFKNFTDIKDGVVDYLIECRGWKNKAGLQQICRDCSIGELR
jgi:hypothetical protein